MRETPVTRKDVGRAENLRPANAAPSPARDWQYHSLGRAGGHPRGLPFLIREDCDTRLVARDDHLSGVPWARIGEHVGQRNLAVTASTYTHVLTDEAELDYPALLS